MSQLLSFSKRGVLALLLAFSLGCNKVNTTAVGNGDLNKQAIVAEDSLACLATSADYELLTDITAFEISSSNSASVGFSLKGILKAIGLGISYTSGNLAMHLRLFEPLKQNESLVAAPGNAPFKKIKFDATVSAWLAELSLSRYKKTRISELTLNTLQNGMANLLAKLRGNNGLEQNWTTVVSRIIDADNFLIPVGSNAHLKVGDQFGLYNVDYEWENEGAPCSSALLMARRLSKTPIAIATVQQVDTTSAYLQISKRTTNDTIQKYAVLAVEKLINNENGKPRDAHSLARSIHIGSVTQAHALEFETDKGIQEVDLTPYVIQQLNSLVSEPSSGGFYLR